MTVFLLDNILFLSLRGEKIVNRKKINITEKLNSIDNLPTLPTIASQLLDLLGDNNSSMMSIARIISADPSLTSKVLRIANSAYYGMRKKTRPGQHDRQRTSLSFRRVHIVKM